MPFRNFNYGTGPGNEDSEDGYGIGLKSYQMFSELFAATRRVAVGGFRASTAHNINVTDTIAWDDTSDRRLDTGLSISANHEIVTVAGTPDYVEIFVNIYGTIATTANNQRPAPAVNVRRLNDGKIIAASATGYIRDASGHEESSNNISVVDHSPLENSQYEIQTRRESTIPGVVSLAVERSQFNIKAFYAI